MSHEPLRVSLDDLRSADTKGKWWLVGAAWGGDPLVERQQEAHAQPADAHPPDAPSENALLKLAKKQGMNTDIRRSIFVVLMSADVGLRRAAVDNRRSCLLSGLRGRMRAIIAAEADRGPAARDHPGHPPLLRQCTF